MSEIPAGPSLQFDALAIVLTAMVLGLSALIQLFAIRYLRGDVRQGWFVGAASLLTGFTVLMVSAGSVAVFAAAWVGAGMSLLLLLATYWPLEQAREGIRRTAIRFAIADAAVIAGAIILVVSAGGDVSLAQAGDVAAGLPLALQLTVAALLVLGALARSSQIPFQGWLPFTLAAPTPVSALMHAGVVNAGAILVIRFAPVIAVHQTIMVIIFLAGASTLVYATAVRLVRPDVKGRLVFSTMAQMGFMIMACGLGLFAAAIFHLIAHSLFKSSLFLGAGMGVRRHSVARNLPARTAPSGWTTAGAVSLAVIVPVVALTTAKLALDPSVTAASLGLLAFVSLTASVALGSALLTNLSPRTAATSIGVTVALSWGYVAFLQLFTSALQPPLAVMAAPAWLFIVPALGLVVVQLVAHNPRTLPWLRDYMYAGSLASGLGRPAPLTGALV
jgi:NAD(P)H-quinone oxidoreductase subunit 5